MNRAIAKRIAKEREEHGLSIRALASQVGISPTTMCRIEQYGRGSEIVVDPRTIEKVLGWFGLKILYVIQRK